MKGILAGIAVAGCIVVPVRSYAIGDLVYDPAAVAQEIQTVRNLVTQVQVMRQQYQQLVMTYQSLTGGSAMTDLLNNPYLSNMLPQSWRGVYSGVEGGGFTGITGALNSVMSSNMLTGTTDQQFAQLQREQQMVPFDNMALSENAYDMEQQRLLTLQQEAQEAGTTQDAKRALDLQNEIAAQTNEINAERAKLDLMSQLEVGQQRIIEAQQQQLGQQILNPDNNEYAQVPTN